MNRTLKAVGDWHFWSELWLSASLFTGFTAGAALLFFLSAFINQERHDWIEAGGIYTVLAVHVLYVPLGWQIYCGHRMSAAKKAADACAADVAKEFDAF